MFTRMAWCSAYLSAVVFCAGLKPLQSHGCSIEKMENVTIDIKAALSKGIRGADPIHTASQEICVDLCCSGGKITATKKCNYAVFQTRRKGNYPNCYLFYYPTEETCPMRPVIGLLTYRIILGAENPKPHPSSDKVSTVTGSFIAPLATAFRSPSPVGLSEQLHPLPVSAASNRPEILSYSHKHWDQMDGHSKNLKDGRAFDSSAVTEASSSLSKSVLNATRHIGATVRPTVKLPAVTSGIQTGTTVGAIPHVPFSKSTTTRSSDGAYRSVLISQSPTKISSSSFHNSLSNNRQVGLEDNILEGFSSKKQIPHFHDASILIAALFFGVIFLILVTVLVGRKMLETLQQRRYTRLDYLINDMYVNM